MVKVEVTRNDEGQHPVSCEVNGPGLECALEITKAMLSMLEALPRELGHAVLMTTFKQYMTKD